MSACDTCPKPGSCCNDFQLHGKTTTTVFPENDWEGRASIWLKRHELPFLPLRIDRDATFTDPVPDGHVAIRYMCPKLSPEGRCGDYENRPPLCRDYQPGQDRLCAVYVEPVTEDQL